MSINGTLSPAPHILTTDDLRRMAPSIFATEPYHGVSENYRFLPTSNVLDILRDRGYFPVKAMQSTTRLPDKQPFTKHLVRLRHADHLTPQHIGAELPELIVCNSHDRTSAYRFMAGVFRLVCSNGMVVASADFGSISVKHSGAKDLEERVIDATYKIVEETPRVAEQIEAWKQVSLTAPQQLAFATAALEIRDGTAAIDAKAILAPRRSEDRPNADGTRDLWKTMNVAQEALTQGGVRGRSQSGRRMTTRPIKAVDADIRTNRALWRLADEMAKLV
ncbi:MAG: DUF932 domain-containing protein [Paludisphaera borealis]|uniref:DUF932 domain-containing protein n=1 Tax=Paludisphaera borealis TaxID=1387353 RepID=UPI00283DB8B1|nr:DUF932 domain-containing protein [Paludisphaera borealis]MDR3620492.1 DUF932 domain-containing protein [Paludisphaera borealis]